MLCINIRKIINKKVLTCYSKEKRTKIKKIHRVNLVGELEGITLRILMSRYEGSSLKHF